MKTHERQKHNVRLGVYYKMRYLRVDFSPGLSHIAFSMLSRPDVR